MVTRLLKDKGIWEYVLAAKEVKSVYPKTKFILVGDIDENPSTLTYDDLKKIQSLRISLNIFVIQKIYGNLSELAAFAFCPLIERAHLDFC